LKGGSLLVAVHEAPRSAAEPEERDPPGPAVIIEEELRVPAASHTLVGFRRWVASGRFPERGRIDYLAGDVEVDMSPEDLFAHGAPKAGIAAILHELVVVADRGSVFVDRARVTSPAAELSAEPDVVVLLWASVETERARLIPSAAGKSGRYVEIEGSPDLVVEVVSDSSQGKDLARLPRLYARAGIPELWQVDARGAELRFTILTLGDGGYEPQPAGSEGWVASPALGLRFRLLREPGRFDTWRYRLEHDG
jgi:Uma2 family endonuclease